MVDAASLVSASRQILLWEKEHFEWLRAFLTACNWEDKLIWLYKPSRLDDMVIEWAKQYELPVFRETKSDDKKKIFQVSRIGMILLKRYQSFLVIYNLLLSFNHRLQFIVIIYFMKLIFLLYYLFV